MPFWFLVYLWSERRAERRAMQAGPRRHGCLRVLLFIGLMIVVGWFVLVAYYALGMG